MEQNKKNHTEMKKFKIEVDIPYVYHEALVNNPLVGEDTMQEKAQKAVFDLFAKMYNNPRVVAEPLKKYLEAKLGAPSVKKKKGKQAERIPDYQLQDTDIDAMDEGSRKIVNENN